MKKITLLIISLLLYFNSYYGFANNNALPPVNDECASATLLTVNTGQSCSSTTTASLSTATVSAQANTCSVMNGGDVWYQFTATSTAHTISLSGFATAAQPAVLTLYQGDCGSLTQLYCSSNNVIIATGLTAGTVYKLRTFYNLNSPNNNSGFTICVTTPPAPSSSNQTNCLVTTINYSFESPPPPAPTTFPVFLNHNAVQGWRTTASDQMMEFWVVPNYENVPSYDGVQFIELNANLVSGVYQDYGTPQPTVFNYGFAHRGRQGTDTCQLLAGPPGGPYTPVHTATTGNTAWVYYTGTYTVPAGQTTTRFIFQSVSSVGGVSVGNYLDAISFTANNGILSANPLNMGCGTGTANVSAAGTGMWVAHPDNPSTPTIANPTGNNTTISNFGPQGVYRFDWTTAYCTSTLLINYNGQEPAPPVVAPVSYCQGQTAVPLTATALPGHTLNWYPDDGNFGAPTPSTAAIGSTTYYVSQTTADGCESVVDAIVVTVNTATPPVTGFTLPATVCNGGGNVTPTTTAGFSAGGQYSGGTGLTIDPSTGEIDMVTTTPGTYTVTYQITEDLSVCLIGGSSTANITINDTPDAPVVTITQPTCAVPSGSITVDSPLGAGLTYSIDGTNYQAGTQFSNLAGGTYTVYAKGVGGCISSTGGNSVNNAVTTPAVATYTVTQPNCSSAVGSLMVTAPVGAGYTYSIDGTTFQADTAFNGLAGNTSYVITVQNASGCLSMTTPIAINAAPVVPVVPVVTTQQPDCAVLYGGITVNSPIDPGYTYSLDGINYQSGTAFSPLTGGNYTVYVKAPGGCVSQLGNVVINTVPTIPSVATYNVVQPNCSSAVGLITVTAPVGAGYTYSIDGTIFQSGTAFTGLDEATNYTITVQNASGCTSVTSPIAMNAAPVMPAIAVPSAQQPDCTTPFGTITVTSPTDAGLTYSIDGVNYQISPQFLNVSAGTYTVYVKSPTNCVSMYSNLLINASPLTPQAATYTAVQPTCTTATGTITVSTPVGNGYTYSIDGTNFQSGTNFAGLAENADYVITVKNAAGCISTTNPIHIDPQPLIPAVADVTVVQPVCETPVGSITVNSPTGTGYTYSINGTSYQASTQFANLVPADHTVYVKNAAGCVSQLYPVNISAAAAAPPIATLEDDHPDCTTSTGTLTVLAPLGPQYMYSIDGVNFQAGTVFSGLTGGFAYSITVRNPLGCTSTTVPVAISTAPVIPVAPTVTVVQPNCGDPGTITVTSPLGTGLMYSLNGVTFQTNPVFTDPPAGNYTVTVKSSGGCVASSGPYAIMPGLAGPGAPVLSITQTNCTTALGSIIVTSPIAADLTYSINGVNYNVGNDFYNLSAGNYTVYVKAANGCIATMPFTINPQPITPVPAVALVTPANCTTGANLVITSPLGPGYNYSIDGTTFQPATTFLNVPAGTYTITVKTPFGCTSVSVPYTVNPSPTIPAMASVTVVQPACAVTTGTITVDYPVGPGFTYSIGGAFQAGTVFTNVPSGSYVLTVQNADGCTSNKSVTINAAQALPAIATATVGHPDCDHLTGTLTIDSPLGAGLSYSINGTSFQTGTYFANLAPGNYTITVKNSTGCTSVTSAITINNIPPFADAGTITGGVEVCEGETLQLANLVAGGTWSSSSTSVATISATGEITALSDGLTIISYSVPATATECANSATITFRVNGRPELDIDDDFICEDLTTGEYGTAYLNTGLSAGYTFEWKKGTEVLPELSGSLTVDEPGEYTVKATNTATGCVAETTVTVGVSSAPAVVAEVGPQFGNSQTITVTTTGGSGNYEYSLDGGPWQADPHFHNIGQGVYTVFIRDINGCGGGQVTVTALTYPHFFSPNGDGERDTWNITGLNNYTTEISIFDRYGKAIAIVRPGSEGWDGTFNGAQLPATDYWFIVKYQINGTDKEFRSHFSLIR
ncbi:T9SS type B sorting domain-containing protein [Flavobacterium sp.]|uniref:T9SS type B sorting domain-containing protein n=1 Tax=Flavobacterium sp. TaxID=239 RepID=UPI0040332E69